MKTLIPLSLCLMLSATVYGEPMNKTNKKVEQAKKRATKVNAAVNAAKDDVQKARIALEAAKRGVITRNSQNVKNVTTDNSEYMQALAEVKNLEAKLKSLESEILSRVSSDRLDALYAQVKDQQHVIDTLPLDAHPRHRIDMNNKLLDLKRTLNQAEQQFLSQDERYAVALQELAAAKEALTPIRKQYYEQKKQAVLATKESSNVSLEDNPEIQAATEAYKRAQENLKSANAAKSEAEAEYRETYRSQQQKIAENKQKKIDNQKKKNLKKTYRNKTARKFRRALN